MCSSLGQLAQGGQSPGSVLRDGSSAYRINGGRCGLSARQSYDPSSQLATCHSLASVFSYSARLVHIERRECACDGALLGIGFRHAAVLARPDERAGRDEQVGQDLVDELGWEAG